MDSGWNKTIKYERKGTRMGSETMGKIITGVLTALVTLIVCLLNNYFQAKRDEVKRNAERQEIIATQSQAMTLIEYKIGELTSEVREHNNFARRMPVIEEQIKVINHRLEDLEHKK